MADTLLTRREQTGCVDFSRDKQTDAITAETGNRLQHPVDLGSRMTFSSPDRTDDRGEINNVEGPTATFEPSNSAEGTFTQSKARPHFINQMMLYGMGGDPTSTSVGTLGFRHDGAWLDTNLMPTFTTVQREGNRADFEQYVGCGVNTLTLSLSDKWVSAEAAILATGLRNTQSQQIQFNALDNATSLTLTDLEATDFGVQGTTAERLTNLTDLWARVAGVGDVVQVTRSAVSEATPAIISNSTIGGAGATVVYNATFYTDTSVAWATTVSGNAASPLRLVDAQVGVRGAWDGTSWTGATELDATTGDTVEFTLNNNLLQRWIPNQSRTLNAQEIRRGDDGRQATISLTRRFADPIFKLLADNNTQDFSLRFIVQGGLMDTGDTERYGFEIVIPQARFTTAAEPATEEGELAHQLNIEAMVDSTYNLFDFNGWDTVSSYMA